MMFLFLFIGVLFKNTDLVNFRVISEIFRLTFSLSTFLVFFCEFDCGNDGKNVNGPVSERKMICGLYC